MLEEELDKIWVIECGEKPKKTIRGGICVAGKGIILTSWLDIKDENLRGRFHGSREWFSLEIVEEKSIFNLALLKVKIRIKGEDEFPYFLPGQEEIDLDRGASLHGVLHVDKRPFSSLFGRMCRPFASKNVEIPWIDSSLTISLMGDNRTELLNKTPPYLLAAHIVSDEHDPVEYDDILNDANEDTDVKVSEGKFTFLEHEMPLIQAHGFPAGDGSCGCPIFDDTGVIIGLYCFSQDDFIYVIPKPVFSQFVNEFMSSEKGKEIRHLDVDHEAPKKQKSSGKHRSKKIAKKMERLSSRDR